MYEVGNVDMLIFRLKVQSWIKAKNVLQKVCQKCESRTISVYLIKKKMHLTYGLGEKEARRPTPKWNTRFYLAFSIRA